MMRVIVTILCFLGLFRTVIAAESVSPTPVMPSTLRWLSSPNNPALQAAWVLGSEQATGPYILRVRLAAGGRIPPHTHPDERRSTVLEGTLYVGYGETFEESKVVPIPAGASCVTPANVSHYVWAKSGDVTYQETGAGPTETAFVKP